MDDGVAAGHDIILSSDGGSNDHVAVIEPDATEKEIGNDSEINAAGKSYKI